MVNSMDLLKENTEGFAFGTFYYELSGTIIHKIILTYSEAVRS